ncbi:MAG: ATP-binding protein [Planctomycetota bacterium]|nr:ATP-binding protein [Planctomycetota bacterium]
MKPRRRWTLFWQLGLVLMAVQIAVAVFLAVYATRELRQFHHEQSVDDLRRLTPLVGGRLRAALASDDPDTLTERVGALGREAGVRVTVIDLEGKVLADSVHDPAEMDNHRYRTEIEAAMRAGDGFAVRRSATLRMDMMYFASVLRDGERPIAVVRTAKSLSTVNAELSRVLRAIGTAGLVLLALTVLVIGLASRRLSRITARLADGAERFARGELDHRIEEPRARELASLAASLNRMVAQLSDQFRQLQVQRNEEQALLESMSSGMIALDLQQRVFRLNRRAEEMLEVNEASARGRLLQESVREPELNRFVADAVAAGGRISAEFRLRRLGDRTVLAVNEPLFDAQMAPLGLLIVLNDVTEVRKLESIRSDFAANVSHELRTPITNIKGYLETMLEVGAEDKAQTERFLEIINRNTNRLEAIVEDLLALARLEQPGARAALEEVEIPLRSVISAAAGHFVAAAGAKNIALRIDVPGEPAARINPQLLEQAVSNLLSNAVKYSDSDTMVTVTARRREDGEVEIAVSDQGPGIAAEHLPRLFERFYRVDRARSRELGGTGLGLAIVKHIALVHGGRTDVESRLGGGSTFKIILPEERGGGG